MYNILKYIIKNDMILLLKRKSDIQLVKITYNDFFII